VPASSGCYPGTCSGDCHRCVEHRAAMVVAIRTPRFAYNPKTRRALSPRTLSRTVSAKPLTRFKQPGMSPMVCG
jgi:hypothetical protein